MERQTYLYSEMCLAIKVFNKLYFEEYLQETTDETRQIYMTWYLFDQAIKAYWETPKKDRPFFLSDGEVETITAPLDH